MIRRLALAALLPTLVLASGPAAALGFDLPHLQFPPAKSAAGSSSGR